MRARRSSGLHRGSWRRRPADGARSAAADAADLKGGDDRRSERRAVGLDDRGVLCAAHRSCVTGDSTGNDLAVRPDAVDQIGIDGVESAAARREVHPLPTYLETLATRFHRFYTVHQVLVEDENLRGRRLALCAATKLVLGMGLGLLGVNAPERM